MSNNRNKPLSLEEVSYKIFYGFLQQENLTKFFQDKNVIRIISNYWNPFDIFYCPISKKEMKKPTYVSHPEVKPIVYDYSSILAAINNNRLSKFGIVEANKDRYLKDISDSIIPIIELLKKDDKHLVSLNDEKIFNHFIRENCNLFYELYHIPFVHKSKTINPSKITNIDHFFIRKKNSYLEFKPKHESILNEFPIPGFRVELFCEKFFIWSIALFLSFLNAKHSPNSFPIKPSLFFYWYQQNDLLEAISKRYFRIFQNFDTILVRTGIYPHQFYSSSQHCFRALITGLTLMHQNFFLYALYSEFNTNPLIQSFMTFIVTPLKTIELITFCEISFESRNKLVSQIGNFPQSILSGISITALLTQEAITKVPSFWRYTLPLVHLPKILLASHYTIHETKQLIRNPKQLFERTYDEQGFVESRSKTFLRRLSRFGLFFITLYSCTLSDDPIWLFITAIALLNESSLAYAVRNADNRYRLMPPPHEIKPDSSIAVIGRKLSNPR